jgi:hypothetical protein
MVDNWALCQGPFVAPYYVRNLDVFVSSIDGWISLCVTRPVSHVVLSNIYGERDHTIYPVDETTFRTILGKSQQP